MSAPIVAYRVQDAAGRGPWQPGLSVAWIEPEAPADRLTESVFDLVPMRTIAELRNDLYYGCACRSREALMRWFTVVERARLQALGFYPVRLNTDLVLAESPWQMFIARRRPLADGATRIAWWPK